MGLRYNKIYIGVPNGFQDGKQLVSIFDPCDSNSKQIGIPNGFQDGKQLVSFSVSDSNPSNGDVLIGIPNGFQDGKQLVSFFLINCSDPEPDFPPPPPPGILSCCDITKQVNFPYELDLTCKYGTFKLRYKEVVCGTGNRFGWYSNCVSIGNFCFHTANSPYYEYKPYEGQFYFLPNTGICLSGFMTWTTGSAIGLCPDGCDAIDNLGCTGAGYDGSNFSDVDPLMSWPAGFDQQASSCDTVYVFKYPQVAFIPCPQQRLFLPDDTLVITP